MTTGAALRVIVEAINGAERYTGVKNAVGVGAIVGVIDVDRKTDVAGTGDAEA